MAKIIGTSDAWKSVCLALNRANFKPEKPSDIRVFLEATKKEYALAKVNAIQDVQNKIDELKKDIEQREKNFDAEIQRGKDEISTNIKSTQIVLRSLQGNFIQKIFNYFKIRKHREKIRYLKTKYNKFPHLVQRRIDQLKDGLEKTQRNFENIVGEQCKATAYKVNLLENILKSPEFAGGIAELELIESLKTLPDNYYVINDVTLEIRRAIRFDGLWLKSAQIDHIVVAPSGIFVIEVKNWSKKFMQDGDYFDPYQQVKRARYLCFRLIGERYNLKTRSIIAHKGFVPKKPSNSQTKVLAIGKVRGYVLGFKESNVSDPIVEKVASWFAS